MRHGMSNCIVIPSAMERIEEDIGRELRRAEKLLRQRITDAERARQAVRRLERLRIRHAAMEILLVEAREEFHPAILRLRAELIDPIDRLEGAVLLWRVFGAVQPDDG